MSRLGGKESKEPGTGATPEAAPTTRALSFPTVAPRLPGTTDPKITGVLLTLGAIIAIDLMQRLLVPFPTPAAALLIIVAMTAYRGGMRVGLTSAVLVIGYEVFSLLVGHGVLEDPSDPFLRLVTLGLSMLAVALIVGRLRVKLDDVLREERVLREEAEQGRTRLARVLQNVARAQEEIHFQARQQDSVGQAVVATDRDGIVNYWNRSATRLFGWLPEEAKGMSIARLEVEGAGDAVSSALARVADGAPWSGELLARRKNGTTVPVMVADSPLPGENGTLLGMVRVAADLSPRKHAEDAQRLLADVGSVFAGSFDYEATLRSLARITVPGLADCCIVDLLEDDGKVRDLEVAHIDPTRERIMRELRRRFPMTEDSPHPIARAMRSGRARLIRDLSGGASQDFAGGREQSDMVARLNHRSAMIVPLRVGDRTLGSIAFFTADDRRRYDDRDLALAEELGRRAALALDRARLYESALVANQAKADFLAVMSHELRTPLTTVMGYTDLLLTGLAEALSDKATEYVQRVRTAAWHLLGLIEQILVYARIEVGREKMQPERLHVGDLLRDVASLIEPVAAERGLNFHVKGPSQPGIVETDLTKIRQILLNLLANAVKFTDQGVVWLEAEHEGDGIVFTVRDTGIGIAPEYLERVFDPFWQVDQSETRTVGGTGLGLSVSRRLARLLGGDVTVESTPGHGAIFRVRIPSRWQGDAPRDREVEGTHL